MKPSWTIENVRSPLKSRLFGTITWYCILCAGSAYLPVVAGATLIPSGPFLYPSWSSIWLPAAQSNLSGG